jgi:hypothetical protein
MKVVFRSLIRLALASVIIGMAVPPALADRSLNGPALLEDFTMQPETRWRFITDQVMGGVSTGGVVFTQEDRVPFARMTGQISTANRGGFIQMRLDLPDPPPEGTRGVLLVVRGNSQRYFVHLRTGGTLLPWQYYQAGFDVSERWSEIRLPFDAFKPSGAFLRDIPRPDSLKSIAVVAYGRDHDARIDIRKVGFY